MGRIDSGIDALGAAGLTGLDISWGGGKTMSLESLAYGM